MLDIWRRIVIGSAVAVYLVGLGCAGALLVDQLRADPGRSGAERVLTHWLLMDGADHAGPVTAREGGR